MRNRFDRQLEKMNELLIQMGELCAEAISNTVEALKNDDRELAKRIYDEDTEIDQLEKDIERICLKLLLQQQPVAKDLRLISSALKMITDMERIGDQTADIADIIRVSSLQGEKPLVRITIMAEKTSKMVRDSVTAFVNKDLELAQTVMKSDDEVDQLFTEVREKLINMIKESTDKGQETVDLLMIAKYLERIGDHATNIAEWVEFSITGVHHSPNEHGE